LSRVFALRSAAIPPAFFYPAFSKENAGREHLKILLLRIAVAGFPHIFTIIEEP
jgi:hypothetical protein